LRYINGNANKYQRKKQPYLKNTLLLCEANQGRKAVNEIKYNKMENRELTPEQKVHVSKKWKCTPENFSNKFDVSRETI
jgi:hypothetical protein